MSSGQQRPARLAQTRRVLGCTPPQGHWPGPQARRPGKTELREMASCDEIARSEVPLESTIAGYVLEAVGRSADEVEDTANFSLPPRGFRVRRLPDHRGTYRSAASSDQATPEPLSPAVDSVRRAHRRRGPFGARRRPAGQSHVRGGGRAVRGPWSSRRLARVRGNRLDGDHGRDQVEGFGSHPVRLRPSRRVGPARRAHRPRNGPHATHRIGPSFPQCRSLPRAVPRSPHPRAAEGAFGQAFNHIQDIYADDLAFLVFATDGDDRAYEFFSGWIEGNATMRGRNRWKNVGLAATNGFALGNLVRHRRLSKDDPMWDRARAFDREAGLEVVGALANFYANLPENPSPEAFIGQVNSLATVMTQAASS